MKTKIKILFCVFSSLLVFCILGVQKIQAVDGQCVCNVWPIGQPSSVSSEAISKTQKECAGLTFQQDGHEYQCDWVGGETKVGTYGCWCDVKDLKTGNINTEKTPLHYNSCGNQTTKDEKEYSKCHWEGDKPDVPCDERDDVCDFIDCKDWCLEDGKCVWEKDKCSLKEDAPTSTVTVAQPDVINVPPTGALNPLAVESIQKLIGNAIQTLMGLLGSVALVMFVYGGVLWMTAMGNGEKTKKATQIIIWSSLGVIVILASWTIVDFVFEAFR